MAPKKNRPQPPDQPYAPIAEVPATQLAPESAAPASSAPAKPLPSPFEVTFFRVAKWVGSLQLAVITLCVFVVAMILGTMVESWYSAKLAQDLIYASWWFLVMMGVLFLNIFFAAAKKWPWKKHQTGFVITHIGLLMLITGGVVNSLGGVDSLMRLVSEPIPELEKQGIMQTSDLAFSPDAGTIEVAWPKNYKGETRMYSFDPGHIQWHDDQYLAPKEDTLLSVLRAFAEPLPRSWSESLDFGARLEVLNFYPYVEPEWYYPATEQSEGKRSPAIRFTLQNPKLPMGNRPSAAWISYHEPSSAKHDFNGIALVELLTPKPITPAQIKEFLNPPMAVGPMGELVIFWDGKVMRLNPEKAVDAPVPLGDGWSLKVEGYFAAGFDSEKPDMKTELAKKPANPILGLSIIPPDGKPFRAATSARRAEVFGLEGSAIENRLQLWYNPPDYRYGNNEYRGVLQFAYGQDGTLHYRSFNSSTGKKDAMPADPHTIAPPTQFKFEGAGTVKVGSKEAMTIWGGMEWKLKVSDFIENAVRAPKPLDEPPGVLTNMLPSAIRCRLTVEKGSTEFWLIKDQTKLKPVNVGGEAFSVGFHSKKTKLPFQIKLLRAEQTSDPGTRAAASFSSWVQVIDDSNKTAPVTQEAHIWMNNPLDYGKYKFFQTGMDMKIDPDTLKPYGFSTFTVAYDPGLFLKYLGSIFLALGIAIMFYMKAYTVKQISQAMSKVARTVGVSS